MFDQILQLVKEHLGGNPEINSKIPEDKQEAVHKEVASHITDTLKNHAAQQGGVGGLLSMLKSGISGGSPVTGAIEGGLVSSLASKFNLPPAVTGAIAGAIPGLLQKFLHKADDPNDSSITKESLSKSISDLGGGALGNLFK